MKTNFKLLCVLAMCVGLATLLTACGRLGGGRPASDTAQRRGTEIRWGHGLAHVDPNIEFVQHINSAFDAAVTPVQLHGEYNRRNLPLPSIFTSEADPTYLLDHDVTRTIPVDMLALFAPNYYNLLRSTAYGMDVTLCRNSGDLLGLPIYIGARDRLSTFSVYRLDVLEQHGVALPNNIVPIEEGRVYFSPTPFTFYQFQEFARIIKQPTRDTLGERYAPAILNRYSQLQHLSVLKGMFGLGSYIVNDNGTPSFYFADPRYKDFLTFMADLHSENAFRVTFRGSMNIGISDDIDVEAVLVRVGEAQFLHPVVWFQYSPNNLLAPDWIINRLQATREGITFLVTPPEIGPFGHSGVGINSTSVFAQNYTWVIGAHVSDDELATILEIFDYVTFDMNAYVMANFGLEGEHFEWEGTPFESRIIQNPNNIMDATVNYGTLVFSTGVRLPERNVFRYGDNAITQFAASEAGRSLVIPPYREDLRGDFTQQYLLLTQQYGDDLMRIRSEFLFSAIRGEIDIEAEWYAYIDELYQNGLQQFLALIRQFPAITAL